MLKGWGKFGCKFIYDYYSAFDGSKPSVTLSLVVSCLLGLAVNLMTCCYTSDCSASTVFGAVVWHVILIRFLNAYVADLCTLHEKEFYLKLVLNI